LLIPVSAQPFSLLWPHRHPCCFWKMIRTLLSQDLCTWCSSYQQRLFFQMFAWLIPLFSSGLWLCYLLKEAFPNYLYKMPPLHNSLPPPSLALFEFMALTTLWSFSVYQLSPFVGRSYVRTVTYFIHCCIFSA
jgi:hypothetical protein